MVGLGAERESTWGAGVGVNVKQSVEIGGRLALAATMVAALALAACGRKGPLDPPPSALSNPQPYASRPSIGEESDTLAPRATDDHQPLRSQADAAAPPANPGATPPPKKTFFLDFLLAK
jgi:predicted small lipoprotein YifL